MTDKEKIRAEIERLHEEYRGKKGDADVRRALRTVLFFIDCMQEEPVSENLEEEIKTCFLNNTCKVSEISVCSFAAFGRIARHFAEWQKEQMMANTADAMIGLPYENKDGGYTHLIDVSRPLPVGNNKIAIIFKEE